MINQDVFDIPMGNWIKGYNAYLLMKFTSCFDWQQDFLDGKLFFNTADYFARCEREGQGDEHEGSTFLISKNDPGNISANLEQHNGIWYMVVRDYSDNKDEYRQSYITQYSRVINRFAKIICFYTAYLNTDRQLISMFPKKFAEEFGNYGILILNRKEFFKRVKQSFNKKTNVYHISNASMGFVEYQEVQRGFNNWNAFRKDKDKFEYQNEFRIVFTDNTRDSVMFDLGISLRDIAVPIKVEDVDKIQIVDHKLEYPQYDYM